MSAIMLISHHPEIIKRLFERIEINELGMYGVWLCVDGEWKIIIVDDFIPTENSRAVFSRNNGLELWVMLLEKAYAKAYGSYAHI
jgi:calpain-15